MSDIYNKIKVGNAVIIHPYVNNFNNASTLSLRDSSVSDQLISTTSYTSRFSNGQLEFLFTVLLYILSPFHYRMSIRYKEMHPITVDFITASTF